MIKVLLIGCGNIAQHYAFFLKENNVFFEVHGRSLQNTVEFASKFDVSYTCEEVGSAPNFESYSHMIIAAPIETLSIYIEKTVHYKNLHILCEKPGFLKLPELASYSDNPNLWFAYNRRFYKTVQLLKEELLGSEYTAVDVQIDERIVQVANSKKSTEVKNRWMLANTSHVIDLVFYLFNYDLDFTRFTNTRHGSLPWHPSGQFFFSSYSDSKCIISFNGAWNGVGGWSIKASTTSSDLVLKPLEKLTINTVDNSEEFVEDDIFKPGFHGMLNSFFTDKSSLMSVNDLKKLSSFIFDLAMYERE